MISVKDIKQYVKPKSPSPVGGTAICMLVLGISTLFGIVFLHTQPYQFTLISDLVLLVTCIVILHRWSPWQPVTPKFSVQTAFMVVGFFGAMWLAGQAAGSWFMANVQDTSYDAYTEALSGLNMFVFIILSYVVAPAAEEYFFRGVLLKSFSWYWSPFWAIVLQAVFFAAMHQTYTHLIPTFLVGLYNGFLVYRTGHVWPAVISHMLNNIFAVIAFQPIYKLLPWVFDDPWCWLGLSIMVGCAIAICISDMTDRGLFLVLPSPVRVVRGTDVPYMPPIAAATPMYPLLPAPKEENHVNFDWDEETAQHQPFPHDPWPV